MSMAQRTKTRTERAHTNSEEQSTAAKTSDWLLETMPLSTTQEECVHMTDRTHKIAEMNTKRRGNEKH